MKLGTKIVISLVRTSLTSFLSFELVLQTTIRNIATNSPIVALRVISNQDILTLGITGVLLVQRVRGIHLRLPCRKLAPILPEDIVLIWRVVGHGAPLEKGRRIPGLDCL